MFLLRYKLELPYCNLNRYHLALRGIPLLLWSIFTRKARSVNSLQQLWRVFQIALTLDFIKYEQFSQHAEALTLHLNTHYQGHVKLFVFIQQKNMFSNHPVHYHYWKGTSWRCFFYFLSRTAGRLFQTWPVTPAVYRFPVFYFVPFSGLLLPLTVLFTTN